MNAQIGTLGWRYLKLGFALLAPLFTISSTWAAVESCDCQGGSDVTQTVTLCIAGTNYSATITRCENWVGAVDPCGDALVPDAISYFKKICLDSTVNFNIDDVLKAVLCYYDPCLGNGIGATVPNCNVAPYVFCWSYGFPKCWTRTSAGCYEKCEDGKCCWRTRRYCINPTTGVCGLTPMVKKEWSCNTGTCSESCIVPTTCTPTPSCSTCP